MRRDESLKCWRELFVMQHYNLASMLLPGILPELSPPRAEERVVEPLEKQLDCQLKRLEAVPVCPPNERELDSQEEEGMAGVEEQDNEDFSPSISPPLAPTYGGTIKQFNSAVATSPENDNISKLTDSRQTVAMLQ